jgi:acyl transferase domain-containing protein
MAPATHLNGNIEQDQLEPLAVIGFSLKFPDDAISPDSFWKMMMEKRCASKEIPKDRMNIDALYHPDIERRDTV